MDINILPDYDFSIPLLLSVEQRFERSVWLAQEMHRVRDHSSIPGTVPPVAPVGASPEELDRLRNELDIDLPTEYKIFLRRWRYLHIDDGHRIWSLPGDGLGRPWVSEEHYPNHTCLVVGDCWNYADGDQLLIELDSGAQHVLLYLHEAWVYTDVPEAKVEFYAPSFSLAVWRLVHDWHNWFITECDEYDEIMDSDPKLAEAIRNLALTWND